MVKNVTFVTRLVSFLDDSRHPAELLLSGDQEVVYEEPPHVLPNEQVRRFLLVRGPVNEPIRLARLECLPDGTLILVRREPELDEVCPPEICG